MKNIKYALLAAVVASAQLTGCTAAGGGLEGRFIHEALPSGATVYASRFNEDGDKEGKSVPGTEDVKDYNLYHYKWEDPVPCSDISGVDWWYLVGEDDGEMGLMLVGGKYGNQYYPSPPSGVHWLRPQLWVDRDYRGERRADFTYQEAQALAEHCGVELQVRR